MPTTDVLIQTTLAPALAKAIRRRADAEGTSVSAFVRRIIMQFTQTSVLQAWWRMADTKPAPIDPVLSGMKPTFQLEVLATNVDATIQVRVLAADGRPIRDTAFFGSYRFGENDELMRGRFQIAGSTREWRVVASFADAIDTKTRYMRLLLAADAENAGQ